MEEEKIILKLLLSVLNDIFNLFKKIKFFIKSILIFKSDITITDNTYKIKIKGNLEADLIIDINENLKKSIIYEAVSILNYTEYMNGDLDEPVMKEILNLIGANLINKFTSNRLKLDIEPPEKVPTEKEYLSYKKVIAIVINSNFGEFVVYFCLNQINVDKDIIFLLIGFEKNFIEGFIVDWIKSGITVLYANDLKTAAKIIKSIKVNLCLVDINLIDKHIQKCLELISDKIDYFLNFIIGCNKSDLIKIKNINYFSPYSQILGVFLKNQEVNEINIYIQKLIEECGININDKRRYIRVKIDKKERYFASFYYDGILIKSSIIDLSLVGARLLFDNPKDAKIVKPGDIINNVEFFLNYNHLIFDCTVINILNDQFSLLFNNVTQREEAILAKVIFNLLPHCEKFKEVCEEKN